MRGRFIATFLLVGATAAWAGCGGKADATDGAGGAAGSGGAAGNGGGGGSGGTVVTTKHADKVDLLLMIDNSSSMADKQAVLAAAVPDLVGRFTNPLCVDGNGNGVGTPLSPSDPCPAGATRQFPPVADMHVGIVSSSLGGDGADSCSPGQSGFNPTMADMAHLLDRSEGGTVATYQGKRFLQWDPNGQHAPPGESNVQSFASTFSDLVRGVGQSGCGFEHSLEAVYRFLVDPDPYESVTINQGLAELVGTDQTVLEQRAEFLRPDSLLVVVSISDEDDCSVIAGGQYYLALQASSGNAQFFLPRGTSACLTNPNDKCCVSCGQTAPAGCPDTPYDPECQKPPPSSDKQQALNLRCFDQKRRFGIDFLEPTARYVDGMRQMQVPDRSGQMVANPIFSDLQCNGSGCKPPRDPSLVAWAMIVGVPWQDIARDPKDLTKGLMSPEELAQNGRWDVVLGDPSASPPKAPSDPLMIQSIDPRVGANPITGDPLIPPGGNGWNPMNGHEWDVSSRRDDLQYACIFPFPAGQTKDCAANQGNCDCADGPATGNPLCAPPQSSTYGTTQYGAKGYPGTRHLAVAKGLGSQAIVASICPANLSNPGSPDYGYRPAASAIVDHVAPALK